ncbi:MAG: S1C family serine protease, partial [Bacteroidota bacterium]
MKNARVFVALSVLLLTALACQAASLSPSGPTVLDNPTPAISLENGPAPSNTNPAVQQDVLTALYQQVSPGIVAIQVVTDQGGSLGSGFVYDNKGYVVTNYHVVEGANKVEVDFMSGLRVYGTIVGTDLDSDLAVIKVDAPAQELHPVPLGDSSGLLVGQTVVAIGNPFGLNGTMTVGIISALGRTLESAHSTPEGNFFTAGDILQTDAAINPGNSGGPLFNLNGQVIGVNRAIRTTNFTDSGEPVNSGIGFAIAVNVVKRVVPVLISAGKYDYPYLGVSSLDDTRMNLEVINALGLKSYTGAYVTSVVPNGPADKAGIKAGEKPTNIPNLMAG